jgi:outer membrane lipoprotein-sorting protein
VVAYDTSALSVQQQDTYYVISLSSGHSLNQKIWIDPTLDRVVKYSRSTPEDTVAWECSFSEFTPVAGTLLPMKLDCTFNPSRTRLMITYETVDTAAKISPDLFFFAAPPGAQTLPLEALQKN